MKAHIAIGFHTCIACSCHFKFLPACVRRFVLLPIFVNLIEIYFLLGKELGLANFLFLMAALNSSIILHG